MRARPDREIGFSLLEMLLAVAIAAIVMGVSAPTMQRLYSSSQYHAAVNDIFTMLSSARHQAIRGGAQADVIIDPKTRVISLGEKVQPLPKSLFMEVLGSRELNRDGAGIIRFYSDGGSSGGYINLTSESGVFVQVQVDWLLGRVSLCKENCPHLQ